MSQFTDNLRRGVNGTIAMHHLRQEAAELIDLLELSLTETLAVAVRHEEGDFADRARRILKLIAKVDA